jgi:hypothetical protein
MDVDLDDRIESVLLRPRMYCSEIQTCRDLLLFIEGIIAGRHLPTLGQGCTFYEFISQRLGKSVRATGLLVEFGDKPLFQACEELFTALREWKAAAQS